MRTDGFPSGVAVARLMAFTSRMSAAIAAENQARNENKPEAALPKIVEGRVKKFVEESSLLTQPYIRDPDKSVAQLVKETERSAGAPITITGYVRYAVGEGIDRPDADFSGEVAAMARQP